MQTLIFRALAPYLTALIMVFAVFVFLRGHNQPGGGFIGGLIAASSLAIYGLAYDVRSIRRALVVSPIALAAFGLLLALLSGIPSFFFHLPFLTGIWESVWILGIEIALSTPILFDLGVFLVVMGAVGAVGLCLEENELS